MRIRCNQCGYECEAAPAQRDALNQYRVGGQHVCDRFEAGVFRRVRTSSTPETPEPAKPIVRASLMGEPLE